MNSIIIFLRLTLQFGMGAVRVHPGSPLLLQLHRRRPHQRHQDAVEAVAEDGWNDCTGDR